MSVSAAIPLLVIFSGTFLLIKLRFFFILHPIKTLRIFFSSLKEKESRASLSLALAGTLGVGNIFGVAAGIMIGGAGSVLWLLLSSVFSMVIKYSEALLSSESLTSDGGGMHLVLKRSYKKGGKFLSLLYAALCLALALLMGSAIQSKAAYDLSREIWKIELPLFSVLFVLLIIISVKGGGDKIERITSYVIPLTTFIYIILAFSAIFRNFSRLYDVLIMIIKSAFSPEAAAGGVFAFLSSRALREGFCRGILSNEAGVGTSSMAHSRAKRRDPATAGLYGMCEVFFDTVLLCPLTALMILTSQPDILGAKSSMSLVCSAVSGSLGRVGAFLLTLCILSFAYSTVSCWFYYGSECTSYLFRGRFKSLFTILFLAFIPIGASFNDRLILASTDTVILFMSLMTVSLLIKEAKKIKELTKNKIC